MRVPEITATAASRHPNRVNRFDAIIIGAGFGGMCLLHKLREAGLRVLAFDTASDVGGTWYWNRFPGATTDVESVEYSYSFSDEIQQEWSWSSRYASQPELLRYARYVAEKLNLYKDIQFETRVRSAIYDEIGNEWLIETHRNERFAARFCVMATGILSVPKKPAIEGIDLFEGEQLHTARWPLEPVSFKGKRVGIIGTGSTGIQCIPHIAREAEHLYVFQRTPNFSIPLRNGPLPPEYEKSVKANYDKWRRMERRSNTGWIAVDFEPRESDRRSALEVTEEERKAEYEFRWRSGGLCFYNSFKDLFTDKDANESVAEFVRSKIRETVRNPAVAELLVPKEYFFGAKRLCADTNYFETYNRANVTLVDVNRSPITGFTPTAVHTGEASYEIDSMVFATGFDAVTGAMKSIDIVGAGGCSLRERWKNGPKTYLGLMSAGFPNMFMIGGPGSAFANYFVNIEANAEWITECIRMMRAHGHTRIQTAPEWEAAWHQTMNNASNRTLFPSSSSETWFLHREAPGKPRSALMYLGGVKHFVSKLAAVAENGYEGFTFDCESSRPDERSAEWRKASAETDCRQIGF
ncbi:MAG TPA: NAD(P)/FAD-dependent oxidoreductase [Ramlibacter sp.]|nr:NAD(P)/FAD-dependent oxidoreductase [Ramlibacter sp.]